MLQKRTEEHNIPEVILDMLILKLDLVFSTGGKNHLRCFAYNLISKKLCQ